MQTKITVIVDNISDRGMKGEWGLSIMAEVGEKKILLDVGASELFAENLKRLGFDMADIDYAVLSHAHYDHSSGMRRFFADNQKAKFYLRDGAGENCYFKKLFLRKYIGIPKKILADYPDRIVLVSGDYQLCEGVYLIPHKTPHLDAIGKREMMYRRTEKGKREMMYRRTEKGWKPDDFTHEQSLVIDTDKGLVILNSCSHGGAVNIIREISATFPDKRIHALIGGFHLFNKSESEISLLAHEIGQTGIDLVCTGHCTKERAYRIMKQQLGDKLKQFKVGLVMEF